MDISMERQMKHMVKVKKGFTYFENNDVLFAKITPCMENGKGAIAEALIQMELVWAQLVSCTTSNRWNIKSLLAININKNANF